MPAMMSGRQSYPRWKRRLRSSRALLLGKSSSFFFYKPVYTYFLPFKIEKKRKEKVHECCVENTVYLYFTIQKERKKERFS